MADDTTKEKIIIDVQTNADKAAKDVNELSASITQTTEATKENTKANNKNEEGYKSFKAQLREANAELQKQVSLYGATSEQAIKAAKGVADLKDTMAEAKDLSEAFNPDQKFKALGAATQLAATGIQGATAGMALFGDQSQDTEKLLLKVQAAMAFSDAISGLSDLGDQWSLLKATVSQNAIVTKANTAATGAAAIVQKLFTGSVDTTSFSFKALKGVIAGLGIGLLITGLIYVVNNFDKLKKTVENVIPGLSKVADFIGDVVNAVTDFIGVTSEADRAIDRMKANADKSLALNKKFLDEHGSQLDEYTKQKLAAVDDYHNLLKEDGANQVALYSELQRKLGKIDQDRQDEIDKNREEARKKAEEERKKREEEAKKQSEEADKALTKKILDSAAAEAKRNEIEQQGADDALAYKELITDQNNELDQKVITSADIKFSTLRTLSDEELAEIAKASAAKKENQDLLVSQGEALIQNVAKLAGKNKAIQKAAIIADGAIGVGKAVANTAEAVTKDLAKGAPFSAPLVALDLAVGATSVASIIQGTSKALQAVGGGSGPSAPSLPSASGVNASPQTGFQASSENQIATSINGANQSVRPIKAFVVGSDVTTQQGLDAALVSDNSFGGKTGG